VWLFEIPTSVFADTTWRRKSLVISVVCNLLSALMIVILPTYWGFIISSAVWGLYFAFWSGTGQAFLEDNLRHIWKEKSFWKAIGHLMSLETLSWLIVSLVVSCIIKRLWESSWYTTLAILDIIFALVLVILTLQLKEINPIKDKLFSIKRIFLDNYETAKNALRNIFVSKDMRTLLIYRSLSNHVAFLFIISLPLRIQVWMEPWLAWILWIISTIAMFLANKYAYKFWERWSYNHVWVLSTTVQAILLIIVAFFLKSWIMITIIMILFNFFEGLRMPAWNHVLVGQTKWIAISTTRSIVFSVFALYTTVGKQVLSTFPIEYALIALGIFILIVNAFFGKKILALSRYSTSTE
jgi:MFS family permease